MMQQFTLAQTTAGLAQAASPAVFSGEWLNQLISTIIYCLVGVVLLLVVIKLIDVLTPFSISKEIAEDQNTALGVVIAGVIIGISIILAASVHG